LPLFFPSATITISAQKYEESSRIFIPSFTVARAFPANAAAFSSFELVMYLTKPEPELAMLC
jgi:hypothetical protein